MLASLAVAFALPAATARAHDLRPALLSVTEVGAELYDVEFGVPIEATLEEAPAPIFPAGSERAGGTTRTRFGAMSVERFRVQVPGGLAGRRLGVRFAGGGGSEVLVRVASSDGRTSVGRLAPGAGASDADWLVPAAPSARMVAGTYLRLGVEHILTGLDHLAFVLALVLLTRSMRRLGRRSRRSPGAQPDAGAGSDGRRQAAAGAGRGDDRAERRVRRARAALNGRPGSTAGRAWPWPSPSGWCTASASRARSPRSACPNTAFRWRCSRSTSASSSVSSPSSPSCSCSAARFRARDAGQHPVARFAPSYVIGGLAAFWCIGRVARFWGYRSRAQRGCALLPDVVEDRAFGAGALVAVAAEATAAAAVVAIDVAVAVAVVLLQELVAAVDVAVAVAVVFPR